MYQNMNTGICLLLVTLVPMQSFAAPRVKRQQQLRQQKAHWELPPCDSSALNDAVTQCNVSKDICTICMVAAAIGAIFTFGASGLACAAPCGIAAGMCGNMDTLRASHNQCLADNEGAMRRYAEALEGRDRYEAEWLPKIHTEVERHENVIKALRNYPNAVTREIYSFLKKEGIDSDSPEASEFIFEKMIITQQIIDQKLEEEKLRFYRFYTENFGHIWIYFENEEPWHEFIDECQSFTLNTRAERYDVIAKRTYPAYTWKTECFIDKCVEKGYFNTDLYPSPPYTERLYRCPPGEGMRYD